MIRNFFFCHTRRSTAFLHEMEIWHDHMMVMRSGVHARESHEDCVSAWRFTIALCGIAAAVLTWITGLLLLSQHLGLAHRWTHFSVSAVSMVSRCMFVQSTTSLYGKETPSRLCLACGVVSLFERRATHPPCVRISTWLGLSLSGEHPLMWC